MLFPRTLTAYRHYQYMTVPKLRHRPTARFHNGYLPRCVSQLLCSTMCSLSFCSPMLSSNKSSKSYEMLSSHQQLQHALMQLLTGAAAASTCSESKHSAEDARGHSPKRIVHSVHCKPSATQCTLTCICVRHVIRAESTAAQWSITILSSTERVGGGAGAEQ